ncbi:MAG: hypothetical protein M1816_006546 [Peltula sp. TS41687]|nr:MAG: hypothetical protein M1816_006546 [Peltula sp. TS41687]
MNHPHHLSAGPHVLPALPLHPGRRSNDHYLPPPIPSQQAPHHPVNNHHPVHPQAQPYPPHHRPYPPYLPPSFPPVQHYPNAPLIVSSYPHSQPPHPPRTSTSSTHSQAYLSPTSSDNSLDVSIPMVPNSLKAARRTESSRRSNFTLELPWYSTPNEPFPPKARRRRKPRAPQHASSPLELPQARAFTTQATDGSQSVSHPTTTLASSETETPSTSQPPSEIDSTHPTTPSSVLPVQSAPKPPTSGHITQPSRPIVPAIPLTPAIPFFPPSAPNLSRVRSGTSTSTVSKSESTQTQTTPTQPAKPDNQTPSVDSNIPPASPEAKPDDPPATVKAPPKSWAELVRSGVPKGKVGTSAASINGASHVNGVGNGSPGSLADALTTFSVEHELATGRVSFLEPRGLVNTGNMCYMNSRSRHSFNDGTPLLDSLILFLREFKVIDSAPSPEQLKRRLKENELEQYGEAFIPDFVYDVIRRLPRFSSMRRGHQQDAQEFLGFLLEELQEECVRAMKHTNGQNTKAGSSTTTNGSTSPSQASSPDLGQTASSDGGWQEVGPRQKAAVTRDSGTIMTESPITKIFGGRLRSEFRVPGLKNSVTLEPFQSLQLDIQSQQVNSIIDALKGLTRSETLHGDFGSPRGPDRPATKQVFIESLPSVLILHLKRFHYDNAGGTQKIGKKVDYPLDLQIPKEAFPPHKRAPRYLEQAKYRLIGVVYHHGKNASIGHYTVDVRRQEGAEWIRIDDTVIRRIRSEDVTEASSKEEDPKVATIVREQHKDERMGNGNPYNQIDLESSEADGEEGWKQVNGANKMNGAGGNKPAWSDLVQEDQTNQQQDRSRSDGKHSIRDNKVAYLLFYQRV